MKRNVYTRTIGGFEKPLISFAENYMGTFEQFKKEFGETWVFKSLPEKERLSEMKKAFKIASADRKPEKK